MSNVNVAIRRELAALQAAGLIDARNLVAIGERYPVGRWNVVTLVRWFTILGALATCGGLLILAAELVNAIHLAEAGLAAAFGLLIFFARKFSTRDANSRAVSLSGRAQSASPVSGVNCVAPGCCLPRA